MKEMMNDIIHFTADVAGVPKSLLRRLASKMQSGLRQNRQLILNDMIEDNINLKQILETGVYPAGEV